MLMSLLILTSAFLIAWLRSWKQSMMDSNSFNTSVSAKNTSTSMNPDIEDSLYNVEDNIHVTTMAISMAFAIANILLTISIVAIVFAFFEIIFINILRYRLTDLSFSVSLGTYIFTEWMFDWRLVLVFCAAIAASFVFGQLLFIVIYIFRDGKITRTDYRRSVNVIYSFMLISVVSSIFLQMWCSSQKW
jgi:hypothetical protein